MLLRKNYLYICSFYACACHLLIIMLFQNSPGETVCSGEEQEGSHANVTTKEKGSALVDMNEVSAFLFENRYKIACNDLLTIIR